MKSIRFLSLDKYLFLVFQWKYAVYDRLGAGFQAPRPGSSGAAL